ncbi:MAG: zeta toxin family protein [Bacteroidota bacterium]
MVAGPNGSGKTTLLDKIEDTLGATRLGVRINPDEMERVLRMRGSLSLARLDLH